MRSAEFVVRSLVVRLLAVRSLGAAAVLAALAGCATVMEPIHSMRDAVMPSSNAAPATTTTAGS